MLRLASIVVVAAGISSIQAAQPYRLVLTDVEKNIYKETAEITSSELAPKSLSSWSVRKYVLRGGRQEGVDVIEVNNGKLRFTVIPTRGMSVYQVEMDGLRLGWDSRRGMGRREGFEGWMIRYGLKFFGGAGISTDNTARQATMDPTLHGRIGTIPASQVELIIEREAPYRITVRGRVDEALPQGSKLEILTQISTVPGADTFQISDTVTNRSAVEQEFGVLYHGNYGPPLMEKGAKFFGPVRQVIPIDDDAATDVSNYNLYRGPKAGSPEEVYFLRMWADENDRTRVMLRNAEGDRAVSMAYSVKELPFLALRKNQPAGEDAYVTGLEPSTGFPRNTSIEREFGRAPKLAPQQSRSFTIDFALHASKVRVNAAADDVARIWAGRSTKIDKAPPAADKPKPKLTDVINAARTWGPGFTPWRGKPAPDFTLTDITGKKHKLSDYRGKDVLIIFWATWCPPCRMEIPHLKELRETTSEDDLAMLAISNERPDLVRSFVEKAKMNYTVLTDPGTLPSPYNTVSAIPSSFFIDREGKIKLGTTGLISLDEIKAILQAE